MPAGRPPLGDTIKAVKKTIEKAVQVPEAHLHSQLSDMEDQVDYLKDRIANLEDANSRMLDKILGD